jgi:tyrosyl-DNA phosphodiesterase-1
MAQEACRKASIDFKGKLSRKELQSITPNLHQLYRERYGRNYHSFYAWSSGSSHTKMLVLVYPDFLRLVITSCNMMNFDTVLGDNHWYIHDMPKLSSRAKSELSSFEADLLAHLQALGTPDIFLDSIRGMYDYSKVKVHLVTSVPGVCAGVKAEKYGLLRLRCVIQGLALGLAEKKSSELRLEVCVGSVGNLSAKWLNGFYDCVLGKDTIKVAAENCAVPDFRLFYPSVVDVKRADPLAQDAASNVSIGR